MSAAGIPIYANKGKGGCIRLLDNFVINKSMLSEKEQDDILSSLQSLNALKVPDVEPVLKKMVTLFGKSNINWIDVDFSRWGSDFDECDRFRILKTAIINKNIVIFDYYSTYGKISKKCFLWFSICFAENKLRRIKAHV